MSEKKTAYHHGNLKAALIELAERLIEAGGFENLTMQSLTDGVGVQPSAAYRHFRNREFLLRSLAKRSFDRWNEEIKTIIEQTPPKQRTDAFFRFFFRSALAQPQMFRLMFVSEYGRDSRSIEGMVSFLTLETAIAQLSPEQDEETIRARLLSSWGAIHGTALLLIEGRLQRFYVGHMDTDDLVDHIIATQIHSPP
ncbi:TetR/AcrR family transcriptional regulator [Sphingomonas bisphenolicum]|uniref:TetR family transcriptional regulator n=1 Tax=Sphingomonas bisphenolicum TaxID=296544 RepID=A0ABN5WJT4_9SPHN|nr:TetR/AcrR family transcriptional regulator [Sphingomonas bisphenolicum]BBF72030.1 TetR family transcriptional regulator [Sphingomonas bisphenolicum]